MSDDENLIQSTSPKECGGDTTTTDASDTNDSDVVMTNGKETAAVSSNGNACQPSETTEAITMSSNDETTMDVDPPRKLSVVSNPARFANLIHFGRGLQAMLQVH
jgi:hypothetical protein